MLVAGGIGGVTTDGSLCDVMPRSSGLMRCPFDNARTNFVELFGAIEKLI